MSLTKQIAVIMVLLMVVAVGATAQEGGGLFGLGPISSDMGYNNRGLLDPAGGYNIGTQHFGSDENGGFNIGTQHFGQEAPLGGGWFVLTLAGAAYALKKRRNNHKK